MKPRIERRTTVDIPQIQVIHPDWPKRMHARAKQFEKDGWGVEALEVDLKKGVTWHLIRMVKS